MNGKRLCVRVLLGLLLAGVLALVDGVPSPTHAQSSIAYLGLDMNVAGNGARTRVGVETIRESCASLNQGQTLQIDVFVDEIPADRGVSGFQFEMLFTPSLVTVTASNFILLLDQDNQSDVFSAGDTTSVDGSYTPGVFDFGPVGIEPDGTSEVGPGILARVTLTGQAGVGVGNLDLQNVYVQADDNQAIPVTNILISEVAVNTPCSPPLDTDGDTIPDSTDADDDNDGYTDVVETGQPLCAGMADDDSDMVVNDGCPGGPTLVAPFSEAQFRIGTNPLDPCGIDAWPPDLSDVSSVPNSLNRVNIRDLQLYVTPTRRIGTSPGDPNFDSRYDLVPGKGGPFSTWINVADLQNMAFVIPPFYGAPTRAFNGPECIEPP